MKFLKNKNLMAVAVVVAGVAIFSFLVAQARMSGNAALQDFARKFGA